MKQKISIAIITGAGKRIGRHLALSLAKEGWDIAAHYNHSAQEAKSLCEEVTGLGRQAIALHADLSNEADVKALIPNCSKQLGCPDLLINSASLFEKDELASLNAETFDEQLAVNLKAPVLLSQSFANERQQMEAEIATSTNGNIINLTDQRVQNLNPTFFSYTLSKVGLSAATVTMAQSLAPNIRVNAIAPGPVLQSIHQSVAEFTGECKGTLLGHGTTPEEIFNAVKFILKTNSMTGETITLDGGQHLKW